MEVYEDLVFYVILVPWVRIVLAGTGGDCKWDNYVSDAGQAVLASTVPDWPLIVGEAWVSPPDLFPMHSTPTSAAVSQPSPLPDLLDQPLLSWPLRSGQPHNSPGAS